MQFMKACLRSFLKLIASPILVACTPECRGMLYFPKKYMILTLQNIFHFFLNKMEIFEGSYPFSIISPYLVPSSVLAQSIHLIFVTNIYLNLTTFKHISKGKYRQVLECPLFRIIYILSMLLKQSNNYSYEVQSSLLIPGKFFVEQCHDMTWQPLA